MKKIILFYFYLNVSLLNCQTTNNVLNNDSVNNMNYFTINIQPFLTSKLKYNNKGADLIKSKNLISGEIGLGYTSQINEKWSWQASLNVGLIPYNLTFNFEAPENSIFQTGPYKEDYKRLDFNWSEYSYIRLYSSFDVLFLRQFFSITPNDKILLGGGLRTFVFFVDEFEFDYSSSWYIDENNPYVNLFYANINDTTSNRLKFSLQFEASYLKILKNKHKLTSTILFNYSPFKNVEGYYSFSNLGFTSSGTFSQSLSYLGLRFNYFIPDKRKHKHPFQNFFKKVEK